MLFDSEKCTPCTSDACDGVACDHDARHETRKIVRVAAALTCYLRGIRLQRWSGEWSWSTDARDTCQSYVTQEARYTSHVKRHTSHVNKR